MDISYDEIVKIFERQIKLCSGIGRLKMLEMINIHFKDEIESKIEITNEYCNHPEGYDGCNYVAKDAWVCNMRKCKYLNINQSNK